MACSVFKKAVILQRILKHAKIMNTLGVIGTGAALVNYREKKAVYDGLVDQRDALTAVYATYNQKGLFEQYKAQYLEDEAEAKAEAELQKELALYSDPENIRPDGLKVTTVLRVANLVGKIFKARLSIVFTNLSDTAIDLRSAEFKLYIHIPGTDQVVTLPIKTISNSDINKINLDAYKLQPGETKEFQSQVGLSGGITAELRKIVCEAAGKKLITSCPKINILDVEYAAFRVTWMEKAVNGSTLRIFYTNDQPGVLRYCGEAGLK